MQNKNSKWPDIISRKMEKYRDMMFEAERYLWAHPQSGFKEWIAHQYLKEKYALKELKIRENPALGDEIRLISVEKCGAM